MKTVSEQQFEDYNCVIANRNIEVLLKDGRIVKGIVIGYFKEDTDDNCSPIIKWHIINEKDKRTLGIDAFGFLIGKVIALKYIKEVKFID